MPHPVSLPMLNNVRIASPCPVKWEDMTGSDSLRHCAQCGLNVYNFSNMKAEDAERILASRQQEQRLCAYFYRRSDGTILTQNCPVGIAALKHRTRAGIRKIAAAIGLIAAASVQKGCRSGGVIAPSWHDEIIAPDSTNSNTANIREDHVPSE